MRTQIVSFLNEDNVVLHGAMFEPDKKTKKVVIFVHGSADNFYSVPFIRPLAGRLTLAEYSLFAFNNCGAEYVKQFKQIKGEKVVKKIIGFKNELMEYALDDIGGAIKFCKDLGYEEIVLCGHSLGAIKIVYYLENRKFDGKVIMLSPFDVVLCQNEKIKYQAKCHLPVIKDLIPNFDVSLKTYESIWAEKSDGDIFNYRDLLLKTGISRLQNKFLTVIGVKDFLYSNLNLKEIKNYLDCQFKNDKFVLIKNAGHNFEENLEDLTTKIWEFVK